MCFFSFFAMHFSSANIVCEGQVLKVRHLSAGYPCLSSHSTGPPVCFLLYRRKNYMPVREAAACSPFVSLSVTAKI